MGLVFPVDDSSAQIDSNVSPRPHCLFFFVGAPVSLELVKGIFGKPAECRTSFRVLESGAVKLFCVLRPAQMGVMMATNVRQRPSQMWLERQG
jgi:hypothetical protein